MFPGKYALTLYRGDSYHFQFRLWADEGKTTPIDLTGVVAKAEIRDKPSGSTIISTDCVVTLPNIIDMKLNAVQSSRLPGRAAWDLQLTYISSGWVNTVLYGGVTVTADVTDSGYASRTADEMVELLS